MERSKSSNAKHKWQASLSRLVILLKEISIKHIPNIKIWSILNLPMLAIGYRLPRLAIIERTLTGKTQTSPSLLQFYSTKHAPNIKIWNFLNLPTLDIRDRRHCLGSWLWKEVSTKHIFNIKILSILNLPMLDIGHRLRCLCSLSRLHCLSSLLGSSSSNFPHVLKGGTSRLMIIKSLFYLSIQGTSSIPSTVYKHINMHQVSRAMVKEYVNWAIGEEGRLK